MSCSHVLVKVASLDRAAADFRALGFEVKPASARHAHVWFAKGPIIELVTTPAGARFSRVPLNLFWGKGSGTRMAGWAVAGEGFCDVAVLVDQPSSVGVPIGKVVPWERDGIRFSFAYPRNPSVPFLVTPYDPPQHPASISHPNGASELVRVVMDVAPADRPVFDRIVAGDPVFEVSPGPVTRVRAIRLAGLARPLDPSLLHGITVLAEDEDL
ncbi:glyoxalase-like protein [Lentzea atacamensis]|uniref:Glyoxalase-like protein n=1 Tax=Lentzea atacamensis TaxID=531938 RepID=A0ABX9EIU7_9PSEU|nr:VOC family protein [Lentzea atacamensis]RAS71117.1 glyoxalase-like protein [Lentzea atacamensis]